MSVMVDIRAVRKSFGAFDVLRGIALAVCADGTHGTHGIQGVADANACPSKVL
jgi:ABC-type sugar transport system ATPase subunit